MSTFARAWWLIALSLLFLVVYEYLHPRLSFLQKAEPSHFWTPYDSLAEQDSTAIVALRQEFDSLPQLDSALFLRDSFRILSADSLAHYVPELDNYKGLAYLSRFHEALRALKAGKRKRVRIGYFGDSTTQGDLCVGVLRDSLQRTFGGAGVGYVPLIAGGAGVRTTLFQYADREAWTSKHYFRNETDVQFDFSIAGDYHTGNNQSLSVTFKAAEPQTWTTCDTFRQVYLYYGKASKQAARLRVQTDAGQTANYTLNDTAAVNRLLIAENCQRVTLSFQFADPQPMYGLSFESETGILVDNIAKRNDTGANFTKIKARQLQAFAQQLDYDLIVLHYGPNVLSSKVTDYSFYEEMLVQNIAYLRQQFPDTDILVVGHPDKAARVGGRLQTDPALASLVRTQRRAAARTQCGFFDLFQAMGGAGTMEQWAKQQPPLVIQDFVHFTHEGSAVVGRLLAKGLGEVHGAR